MNTIPLSTLIQKVYNLASILCPVLIPVIFVLILWTTHVSGPQGKGSDFAYKERIEWWTWASGASAKREPFLTGYHDQKKSMVPVESIYTDDMGILIPLDWVSRLTGKALTRENIFWVFAGMNFLFLSILFGILSPWPKARLLVSILTLFPIFYVPKSVVGPDLFSLYGTLALLNLGIGAALFHHNRGWVWLLTGSLTAYVYLLRQAFGLLLLFTLVCLFGIWLIFLMRKKRISIGRWIWMGLGFALVWVSFFGALRWRDHRLGLSPDSHPKHHTIFHPLYLGIGNIPNNPWGIIYADKYAYDQVYKDQPNLTQKMVYPYSEEYLAKIKSLYLDLWKEDGWRLLTCYLRHFLFVIHQTLGYWIFLPACAYAGHILYRWKQNPVPTLWATLILSAFFAILALLIQSTLIDYHVPFSYPTGVLGRYLIALMIADFLESSPQLLNRATH